MKKNQSAPSLENDPSFKLVVISSSALGIGSLFVSLTVLAPTENGFEFRWTPYALVSFAAGSLIAWLYWRLIFRLTIRGQDPVRASRRLKQAVIGLLSMGVLTFLYPLRFVAEERRTDVLIGLGAAFVALACVGFLLRSVVVLLESEKDGEPRC